MPPRAARPRRSALRAQDKASYDALRKAAEGKEAALREAEEKAHTAKVRSRAPARAGAGAQASARVRGRAGAGVEGLARGARASRGRVRQVQCGAGELGGQHFPAAVAAARRLSLGLRGRGHDDGVHADQRLGLGFRGWGVTAMRSGGDARSGGDGERRGCGSAEGRTRPDNLHT